MFNKEKKHKLKIRTGFTTVELLLVLLIIGVLVLVAFPNIGMYFESFETKEAKYHHQTIVYSIREWSLQNNDHKQVPNNFTVKNSQGKSVSDYLRTYNEEYYKTYILPMGSTQPITKLELDDPLRTYEFDKGKLITTVNLGGTRIFRFEYDPLNGLVDRTNLLQN